MSLMIANSVKRFNYVVFTVLPCVSYRPPPWPSACSPKVESTLNFQFLAFSQGLVASLPDVMRHTRDTGAFEEVAGGTSFMERLDFWLQ